MDSAKNQLADRLKSANNILVTVSRDPSIDQLAACLGLTLLLNKMNKHSVAVFSGQVPSTIEFLKPAETLEKTTDSLRDFIIALDKDKADKLRYKVEDNVVRIFITPYKTSITEKDLEFSQGDFNVDVVVALGVQQQQDLDQAITAHGRILHDATVASISIANDGGNLGTINWKDPKASSLSELVTDLGKLLGDNLLDNQIATALLTGIVAETARFSNDKTSSQTMNASSALMAAGADQQLVASKLEEPEKPASKPSDKSGNSDGADDKAKTEPGELSIKHDKKSDEVKSETKSPPVEHKLPTPVPPPLAAEPIAPPEPAIPPAQPANNNLKPGAKLITGDSPSLGGTLNANTQPEGLDPVTDPMSLPQAESDHLIDRKPLPSQTAPKSPPQMAPTQMPPAEPAKPFTPPPVPADNYNSETLTEIEKSVHSPHLDPNQLESARDQVNQALQDSTTQAPPPPIKALNAQPLGDKLHPSVPAAPPTVEQHNSPTLPFDNTPASSDTDPEPKPPTDTLSPSPQVNEPSTAPPVPPPFAPKQPANKPFDNLPGAQQSPPL
jgi:hypothetical protein